MGWRFGHLLHYSRSKLWLPCDNPHRTGDMAGAQKKVLVRLNSGAILSGYLPSAGIAGGGSVSLLDLEGRSTVVALSDIRVVSYVREFTGGDLWESRNALKRTFPARPRGEGIWLRLTTREGDVVEGLASPDITFLDGVLEDGGVYLTPPDTRGNTQRLFLPRAALVSAEFLGVMLPAARRTAVKPVREPQPWLFNEP